MYTSGEDEIHSSQWKILQMQKPIFTLYHQKLGDAVPTWGYDIQISFHLEFTPHLKWG